MKIGTRNFSLRKSHYAAIAAAVLLAVLLARRCGGGDGQFVPVRTGSIVDAVYALGTVKSELNYNLRLGVTSGIERLHVTEGAAVVKGAPLVSTEGGVTLNAPFSGIISKLYYEKGETVLPGPPVLTLIDPTRTYILVSLDQASAVKVKKGLSVELSFEGLRSRKMTGVVERIYSSNGQFLARIYAGDMPETVLPDMNVDVAIAVARKDKAVMVPVKALKNGSVTIMRDGSKKTVQCKTGIINEGWAEVLDGCVKAGDRVLAGK